MLFLSSLYAHLFVWLALDFISINFFGQDITLDTLSDTNLRNYELYMVCGTNAINLLTIRRIRSKDCKPFHY